LSRSGPEFGRQKLANCRCRNEVFGSVSVTFRHVRRELSTHDADKAFAIWIETPDPEFPVVAISPITVKNLFGNTTLLGLHF
jgi:hypothetical protein